ncbi:mannitol dehydrogenase family protein [Belnapia sp. T6]|uniref:Mannitol dehydrogenase family protein n=1 Tax=Belnapia mucosa TaxID=2804532 RepID=A0ABS1V6E6_9PROT|nr:mannitol dehydrogenase family protein [Belnapia mucosa]MBL6457235.1 mannitol dehydrogenase family protein [Belnapia mucosa]
MELSRAALRAMPPGVRAPAYDPAAVSAGIVHLGPGNFHRAHMARYAHDLMERRADALSWGILGAGLMEPDRRIVEALTSQDGLYTLLERGEGEERATVIGSLAGLVFAGDGSAALLAAMDAPAIRIVSLTVTENGYCLDRATKRLDPGNPLIQADLAKPHAPCSAIGVITEALRRRRDAGAPAFTAMSCDNIQHNGQVLRDAVLAFAGMRDPSLARWIAAEAAFPSTMVDRITPGTTDEDRQALEARHGLRDHWPVPCETFRQWVIEDRFPAGRPPWEEVGAQLVPDVGPYEFMKLRLLNASHHTVAGLGRLMGHAYVSDCLADGDLAALMRAVMDRETGPTVPPVPGVDLEEYKQTLVARFANPAIRDTPDRIVADGSPTILLDPLRDRLRAGEPAELLCLAVAAWMRCARGEDEIGQPVVLRHALAPLLHQRAAEGGPDPAPLLSVEAVFGDLGQHFAFVEPVRRWLQSLYAVGARRTLAMARVRLGF